MPGENDPANLVLPQQVIICACVVVACVVHYFDILFGCSLFVPIMIMCTVGQDSQSTVSAKHDSHYLM